MSKSEVRLPRRSASGEGGKQIRMTELGEMTETRIFPWKDVLPPLLRVPNFDITRCDRKPGRACGCDRVERDPRARW